MVIFNDKFFYIENNSTKKLLGTHAKTLVIEEDFVKDKFGQLWKRGCPNNEGYFTLESSDSSMLMTTIPEREYHEGFTSHYG